MTHSNIGLVILIGGCFLACSHNDPAPLATSSKATSPLEISGVNVIKYSPPDFYVSWFIGIAGVYWTHGVATILTSSGNPTAVYVSGSDVSVAGFINTGTSNSPVYWKNGAITSLTDNPIESVARSVALSGSDVDVAVYMPTSSGRTTALTWDTGILTPFCTW